MCVTVTDPLVCLLLLRLFIGSLEAVCSYRLPTFSATKLAMKPVCFTVLPGTSTWFCQCLLPSSGQVPNATDVHLFRDGIKPTWEDASNAVSESGTVDNHRFCSSRPNARRDDPPPPEVIYCAAFCRLRRSTVRSVELPRQGVQF